ncbi:hypothetical protein MNBD_GAMMA24-1303 [hydrothermal vent metagenome]|uniref:Uncharacterized protein n=1 Tax=hydrothermal vent metagenome TaxID=652676 RepID=A0A3B1C5U5_9ZZZZ
MQIRNFHHLKIMLLSLAGLMLVMFGQVAYARTATTTPILTDLSCG